MEKIKYVLGVEEYIDGEYRKSGLLDLNSKIAETLGFKKAISFWDNVVIHYVYLHPEEVKLFCIKLSEKL